MIEIRTDSKERLCQGDVLENVELIERMIERDGILEISKIIFPVVIVLSQDCDLEWDHLFRSEKRDSQDKWLISALVAPFYNAEHVFAGEQLSEVGMVSQSINKSKTEGRLLQQNCNPRYHYVEFPDAVTMVPSVIDFKHYFSAPVPYLEERKATHFVCQVSELYREDISHRFAAFLSRIGLPVPVANSSAVQRP